MLSHRMRQLQRSTTEIQVTYVVLRVHLRSALEQQLGDFERVIVGREHERRLAVLVIGTYHVEPS